jgi:ribokinase
MVVVFGSVNLDLVAGVARMPDPGETLIGTTFAASPGGKGANQALAARRAGAEVRMVGAVGRDAFAAAALASLRDEGVDVSGVHALDAPTGVALIHVDAAGENAITVVPGANALADAQWVPTAALDPATTVVMQLEVPQAAVAALAARARGRGARVVLNAAPASPLPLSLCANLDILVVNELEARALAAAAHIATAPEHFAAQWKARFGSTVVVTLGAGGLVAAGAGLALRLSAPAVEVVDTIGAGDALVGALAAALDRGAPLDRALKEGLAAGSLACTRHGAQPALPSRAEIAALAMAL